VIRPVDPTDTAVADTIADWAATDGTVAIRMMVTEACRPMPPTRQQQGLGRRRPPRTAGQSPVLGAPGAGWNKWQRETATRCLSLTTSGCSSRSVIQPHMAE
jgi:hypothetical protein